MISSSLFKKKFIECGILEDVSLLSSDDNYFLNDRLRNSGWFLVRNILDVSKITEYKKLIQKAFLDLFDEQVKRGINPKVFDPSWLQNGHRTAFDLYHAQVHPENFARIHPGKSLFDVIESKNINKLMNGVFRAKRYYVAGGAHSRRVTPLYESQMQEKENNLILQKPIPYHIDAQYYVRENFGINLWIAMDDCGTYSPSMRVASSNIEQTQDYFTDSNRSKIMSSAGSKIVLDENRVSMMEQDPFLVPLINEIHPLKISIGDLLVFTNWTVHSTHHHALMSQDRQSIELRFHCDGYRLPE